MSELSESEIKSLIDKFELNIRVKQWSEYSVHEKILFSCLTVPEDETPLEYVQTLFRDAKTLYKKMIRGKQICIIVQPEN